MTGFDGCAYIARSSLFSLPFPLLFFNKSTMEPSLADYLNFDEIYDVRSSSYYFSPSC